MKASLCTYLPDLAQHIILEFLNYRLRCGKYIRQLPKDLPIYDLIKIRPREEWLYFTQDDHPVHITEHYDEDNDQYYYTDDDGYDSFFKISIVTNSYCQYSNNPRHDDEWYEERLEYSYSYGDRSLYMINKYLYVQTHSDYWSIVKKIDIEF
jgi:hypothetical protein